MEEIIREQTLKDSISDKELISKSVWRSFTESEKEAIARHLPREKIVQKWAASSKERYGDVADEFFNLSANEAFDLSKDCFLMEAENYCNTFLWWKENSQGITQHNDDLQAMTKAFKEAMKQLKRIYENKASIPVRREISLYDPMLMLTNIARLRTAEKAFTAHNVLETLCTVIEYYQEPNLKRGAPGLSKATTSLALELAKAYHVHFGIMPTTYRDGNFSNIFSVVMTIIAGDDKETRDHSRAIRTAIKAMQDKKSTS